MTLNSVVFNKNEIYGPISFIDKLSSGYGLLSKKTIWLRELVSQYQAVYLDSYEKLHNLKL